MSLAVLIYLAVPIFGASLNSDGDSTSLTDASNPSTLDYLNDMEYLFNYAKSNDDDYSSNDDNVAESFARRRRTRPGLSYKPWNEDGYMAVDSNFLPSKRAVAGFQVRKRIHTCAFMSRLGLPIGTCFAGVTGRRRIPIKKPRPSPRLRADAYAILEKHWPLHSMLGGGVGRR